MLQSCIINLEFDDVQWSAALADLQLFSDQCVFLTQSTSSTAEGGFCTAL